MGSFLTASDRISQNLTDVARVLGIGITITRQGTDGRVVTGWKITG
jgi:hypothetical protein